MLRFIVIASLFIYGASPKGLKTVLEKYNFNIESETKTGDFGNERTPWQVAIYAQGNNGTTFCGGALIDELWIITAASCLIGATAISAHVGVGNLKDSRRVELAARWLITHENFDLDKLANDVALIYLHMPAPTSTVNSDFIPLSTAKISKKSIPVMVSGWGKMDDWSKTELNFFEFKTITNKKCSETYGDIITPQHICAESKGSKSKICYGDVGGGLVKGVGSQSMLVGISTVNSNGCTGGKPLIFMRTFEYTKWIIENIGLEPVYL